MLKIYIARKCKIDSNKVTTINVRDIINSYDEISCDELDNSDFRSWDNCRHVFRRAACKRNGTPKYLRDINCECKSCGNGCVNIGHCALCDNALALNLAFYLASWGMYRSSFLKSYNHTVHIGALKILMDNKYRDLFDPYLFQSNRSRYIDLTADVFCSLYNYYDALAKKVSKNVSDTLITKIILGVYGCMPAYDVYFKKGIASVNGLQNINCNNVGTALKQISNIADTLLPQIAPILGSSWNKCNIYTPMKIVDMIFWRIGKKLLSQP